MILVVGRFDIAPNTWKVDDASILLGPKMSLRNTQKKNCVSDLRSPS